MSVRYRDAEAGGQPFLTDFQLSVTARGSALSAGAAAVRRRKKMNEFENRIRNRISALEMLPPRGGRVLAGVSGGADSVCLLLVLAALREDLDFDLRAIHIHHGLRERAGEDLIFTKDLCAGLQVPCRIEYVDAADYAAGHSLGVEEACRILRYQCFEQACLEWEAEEPGPDGQARSCRIAVAHHMEDQAETILFHICRGSSIAGLRGMLPVSGRLIRPLLDETRDRIETYLREKRQTWRTDETNLDPSYTRNRLRLQILPLLEQYVNPAALRHLARLGTEAARTEEYLAARTEEALDRCRIPAEGDSGTDRRRNDNRTGVFVSRLLQEPGLLQQRILYLLLTGAAGRKKDIGEVHILALLKLACTPGSGRLDLPAGVTALKSYDRLVFRGPGTEAAGTDPESGLLDRETGLPVSEEAYRVTVFPFSGDMDAIPRNKYTNWVDYDKITTLPVFRKRREGDRITILADGRSKKLARVMIDAHIPAAVRERIVMPALGQEILWLPGISASQIYRITPETKNIMQITVKGGNESG